MAENQMVKKLEKAIEFLADKITKPCLNPYTKQPYEKPKGTASHGSLNDIMPDEALKFTQAALNAAHAILVLRDVAKTYVE